MQSVGTLDAAFLLRPSDKVVSKRKKIKGLRRLEVLSGNYVGVIDDKSRVTIPAKLRMEIGERVVLTRGVDKCISIFTPEAFEDYKADYIENNRKSRKSARRLIRFLVGFSHTLVIDKQGRVILPQDLIDYAGIEKEIVCVGCIDTIELWSKHGWDAEMSPESFDPDELMESLEALSGEG